MRSTCDSVALAIVCIAVFPWTGLIVGLLMWVIKGNAWMTAHKMFRLIIDDCFYLIMALIVLSLMVMMFGAFWP